MINNATPPMLNNILCEFITATRIALNISQEYMAMALEMNQSGYSKREKGYYEFKLSQLEIIAREFKMTLPEFFLKALCGDPSVKASASQYLSVLKPQEVNKMKMRLKREFLQNSNLLLMVLLLEDSLNFLP